MDKEYRSFKSEVRATDSNGEKHITGYCVRFGEESRYIGFYETIEQGAITQDTIDKSDIMCLFNHDQDKVLGRSLNGVGNLRLTVDDKGVMYDCTLLDNELAQTVRSYMEAGLVNESSFAFTLSEDEGADEWYRDPNGEVHRTIRKIGGIYDCSPVWSAAYATTTAQCRGLEDFKKAEDEKKAEREKKYAQILEEIDKL